MKKIFTLFIFPLTISMLAIFPASAQTPITIVAADMPIPTGPINVDDITGLSAGEVPATNAFWDYSNFFGNDRVSADYYPEFVPFFLDAGVDVYRGMTKNINAGFGYQIYQEFDFNANGVYDVGVDVEGGGNTLLPFTGNINDSIFIPAQREIASVPRRIIEFPFTENSSWSSSSRRVTDIIINIPDFGLNYAPLQHAYTWVRQDTIVGWGKMRVYTPDGPSISYDVLMDQIEEYTLDSFYLNGAPAPSALLNAFGITQGQKTEEANRYNFYRKGDFGYLASHYFGDDDTFTNVINSYVGTDNIETAPPSAVIDRATYSTLLYPNPTTGSEINIKVMGGHFEPSGYQVFDAMGRLVKQGALQTNGSEFQVKLGEPLPKGFYLIQLKDRQMRSILSEQFEVAN